MSIPALLSILATNHVDGEVKGMNQLQAEDVKLYSSRLLATRSLPVEQRTSEAAT